MWDSLLKFLSLRPKYKAGDRLIMGGPKWYEEWEEPTFIEILSVKDTNYHFKYVGAEAHKDPRHADFRYVEHYYSLFKKKVRK